MYSNVKINTGGSRGNCQQFISLLLVLIFFYILLVRKMIDANAIESGWPRPNRQMQNYC